jgi:primary-amine oxidase
VKGVQPNSPFLELEEQEDLVKGNAELQAALQRRGITDLSVVHCDGYGTGYFATAEEQGRRLFRVHCYDMRGAWEEWAHPFEGITVMWDANEKKAVRVIDTGVVPVPQVQANFDVESVGTLREIPTPITVQQPLGPSFRLNGQSVSWQKWNFHFRIDRRIGLVLDNVRYQDGDMLRSILYEASVSEMFVP